MAAFLDGTLSVEERARVLEMIAKSGDLYEEFVETSAIAAATTVDEPKLVVEAGSGSNTITPVKKRSRWLIVGPVLMAAGLAAILITPRVVHQGDLSDTDPIERLASTLAPTSAEGSFGVGWSNPAWSATRGASAELTSPARAFRNGVHFVDLDMARRTGDAQAASQSAAAIGQLAASTGGGGAVAAMVEEFSKSQDTGAQRGQTLSALRQFDGPPAWFDLGAWCESARLAARSGHLDAFVGGGDMLRALQGILRRIDAAPASQRDGVRASLDALKAVSQNGFARSRSAAAVSAQLDTAIIALAR